MRLSGIFFALLVALTFSTETQAQASKRAAAGVGAALSDWADRQSALESEIELAKAKAAIELETQRKLQAMRNEQAQPRPAGTEEAKLDKRHPQWVGILTSTVFNTWLLTRPNWYQELCQKTRLADVAGSCIDDFFKAKIVQAE